MINELPASVDEAVRLLHRLIPEAEQAGIAAMTQGDLITLHFDLGQWIREHFALWQAHSVLLAATGEPHPDDASSVIILALWQRLREDVSKVH
jgi:hypothetical protein